MDNLILTGNHPDIKSINRFFSGNIFQVSQIFFYGEKGTEKEFLINAYLEKFSTSYFDKSEKNILMIDQENMLNILAENISVSDEEKFSYLNLYNNFDILFRDYKLIHIKNCEYLKFNKHIELFDLFFKIFPDKIFLWNINSKKLYQYLLQNISISKSIVFLSVPALKERSEDIPVLVKTLVKEMLNKGELLKDPNFTQKQLEAFKHLPWKENLPELRKMIYSFAIFIDIINKMESNEIDSE